MKRLCNKCGQERTTCPHHGLCECCEGERYQCYAKVSAIRLPVHKNGAGRADQ